MLLETFSPMARRVTMQRSKVCLDCGLNFTDINSKDRRVLIKATDLVPLWKKSCKSSSMNLIQMQHCLNQHCCPFWGLPRIQTMAWHGMAGCVKCLFLYKVSPRSSLTTWEHDEGAQQWCTVRSNYLFWRCQWCSWTNTIAGKKRSRPYLYEFPSSKRWWWWWWLCLMSRFNDIEATSSDSQSASPPAVVSYHSQYNMLWFYSLHDVCTS